MKTRLIILLLLAFSASCKNDFLELNPASRRNEENFFTSASDYNNAVMAVYSGLKSSGLYGKSLMFMGEMSTDNTGYGTTRNSLNTDEFQFVDRNYTSLNGIIETAWIDHYRGVSRANAVLDRIDQAAISESLKVQYKSECQFLRAVYYFNLVRLFGDVPLVKNEIKAPFEGTKVKRDPTSEVYQFIIDDLISAEANLPTSYNSADLGRATKWAAKAILGKVYLTQKKYDLAAAKFKEIISAGIFDLMPNYADVFDYRISLNSNKEVIFCVQYKTGGTGQGSNFWYQMAPVASAGSDLLGAGISTNGSGYNQPTEDLEKAYEANDIRKSASMGTSFKNASNKTVVTRFSVKFKAFGQLAGDTDTDFPMVRYADVLLSYAEALNEQAFAADGEAFTYLNKVRARAKLANKTSANTDPSLRITNQNDFRLAIEQERRVEFAFEFTRWFDLVRTGRYVTVLKSKNLPVQDFNTLFLIPQRERDLNPNLTQNSGY